MFKWIWSLLPLFIKSFCLTLYYQLSGNSLLWQVLKHFRSVNLGFTPDIGLEVLSLIPRNSSVFEYGSGASTLYIAAENCFIESVETDPRFYSAVQDACVDKGVSDSVHIKFCNIGPVLKSGMPVRFLSPFFRNKYRDYIQSINSSRAIPDWVIIDGRFRVLCCLQVILFAAKKGLPTNIILDDYVDRKEYSSLDIILGKPRIIKRSAIWQFDPKSKYNLKEIYAMQKECWNSGFKFYTR